MNYICFLFPLILSLPSKEYRPNKDYALFFAVTDYENWPNLRNPISDAKAIAKELEKHYGFETEVLENPTKEQVYLKLHEYLKRSFRDDAQLFIFFTGHGHFEESTKEGFFIPSDAKGIDPLQDSYIPHSRLNRIIDQIPCKHILLNIDACYSGTFDQKIALGKENFTRPGIETSNSRIIYITRQLAYKSRLYITSGGKERTSDGIKYSPFTEKMLEALRSFGGEDGMLTYYELLSKMEKANPVPRSGQFGDHEPGGSFLFVSTVPKRLKMPPKAQYKMTGNTLVDLRDGNEYETMILKDGKRWMIENLSYEMEGSHPCGNIDDKEWAKKHMHYSWEAAQNACPLGWQLPEYDDWLELIRVYNNNKYKSTRFQFVVLGKDEDLKEVENKLHFIVYSNAITGFYKSFVEHNLVNFFANNSPCDGKPGDLIGAYWSYPQEFSSVPKVFSYERQGYMDARHYASFELRAPNELEELNPYLPINVRCLKK